MPTPVRAVPLLQRLVGALALICLCVDLCFAAESLQSMLDRAEGLIASGRAADAYALLEPLTQERAGDAQFDYVFGLAAIESGHYADASLALARVISTDPQFAAARMELARAYFNMGAYAAARSEFLFLDSQNPPPVARQVIDEHLLEIERLTKVRPQRLYYAQLRAGYDSNANSATDLQSFLGFTLTPTSREASTGFSALGGGLQMVRPVAGKWLLDTGFALEYRDNSDASFVNSTTAVLGVYAHYDQSSWRGTVGLQGYAQDVDGQMNSHSLDFVAHWEIQARSNLDVSADLRFGPVRYGKGLESLDVDRYVLGGSAEWRFGGAGEGRVGGSALVGWDDTTEMGSLYGRDFYGLRGFGSWAFTNSVRGQLSFGTVNSNYDDVFFPAVFNAPREDELLQSRLSVDWQVGPRWMLFYSIDYYDNSTNVDIFAYDRFEIGVALRRFWQ